MSDYILTGQNGEAYTIQEDTALVFIDETGEENLADSKYPIFGFGGCCVLARNYQTEIVQPWKLLKAKYFSKTYGPLHATDIRNPKADQLDALNSFFSTYRFGRFATIISDKTVFEVPNNLFQIAASSLYLRLVDILKNIVFSDIAIIFEEAERTRHLC